jgi:hypothetical protein
VAATRLLLTSTVPFVPLLASPAFAQTSDEPTTAVCDALLLACWFDSALVAEKVAAALLAAMALDATLPLAPAVMALSRSATVPPSSFCTPASTAAPEVSARFWLPAPAPRLPWLLTTARSLFTFVTTPTPACVLSLAVGVGAGAPATERPSITMLLPAAPLGVPSASLPVAALEIVLPCMFSVPCNALTTPGAAPCTTPYTVVPALVAVCEAATTPLPLACRLATTAEPAKVGAPLAWTFTVLLAVLPLNTADTVLPPSVAAPEPRTALLVLDVSTRPTWLPCTSACELWPEAACTDVTTRLPAASYTAGPAG